MGPFQALRLVEQTYGLLMLARNNPSLMPRDKRALRQTVRSTIEELERVAAKLDQECLGT
jgi:hypothetical protein